MNKYRIQLKLHTLAKCAPKENGSWDSFTFEDTRFEHWYFTFGGGHKGDAWLVSSNVLASNFRKAEEIFAKKLHDIVPKIAFISQCYTEYLGEPFLIHKEGSNAAYFRYVRDRKATPLHFNDKSLEALRRLAINDISNEFFYYWNDMVNSTGYSSKLLLMCSALEALEKSNLNKKNKHHFREDILGKALKEKIYADNNRGIRHRLVHGEYFSAETDQENYLDQIYRKVIKYFNDNLFEKKLISERVVNPQRNPYGNKEQWSGWLKNVDEKNIQFDLRATTDEWDKNGLDGSETIEIILLSEAEINDY